MAVKPKTEKPAPVAAAPAQPAGALVDLGGDINAASIALPKIDECEPFILAYHPARWGIIAGRCAPALVRVPVQPGLNGAEEVRLGDGRKVGDWRAATRRFTDRGYTVIPHAKGPAGSYMQAVKVEHGTAHLTVWETPRAGSRNVTVNTAGYVDWCLSLVDSGEVPAPAVYALEELREKLVEAHTRASDKAVTQPSAKLDVTRLTDEIASVDAMLAKYGEAAPVAGAPVGLG